jgi:proline dehydrogenase
MLHRYVIPERLLKQKVFNMKMKGVHPILDYAIGSNKDPRAFEESLNKVLLDFPNNYHIIKLSSIDFRPRSMSRIMRLAAHTNNSVILEGEELRVQERVDRMADDIMWHHENVFKTYQMYRRDSLERLEEDILRFRDSGKVLNVNLVRGSHLHTDSPSGALYETKEQTDEAYDRAVDLLLSYEQDVGKVIFATQNERSFDKFARSLSPRHFHASVLGFEEPLAWKGRVARMVRVPFGPYHKTYPYIFARILQDSLGHGTNGRVSRARV